MNTFWVCVDVPALCLLWEGGAEVPDVTGTLGEVALCHWAAIIELISWALREETNIHSAFVLSPCVVFGGFFVPLQDGALSVCLSWASQRLCFAMRQVRFFGSLSDEE